MGSEKNIIAVFGNNNRFGDVTSSVNGSELSFLKDELKRLKAIIDMKEGYPNITQHGNEINNNFCKDENEVGYKDLIKAKNEEIRALKEVISLLKEELKFYKEEKR